MAGVRRNGLARFEALLNRHFVVTVVALIAVPTAVYVAVVAMTGVSIDTAGKVIDAIFKIIAALAGAAWVLNRYFVQRTDALQIRIDPHVESIPAGSFASNPNGMLIYRLDVVNTGQSLLDAYQISVEVASAEIDASGALACYELAVLPWHDGARIEPGSWAAVSSAVSIGPEVQVVRLTVLIRTADGPGWSWHQMFRAWAAE